MHILLLTQVLPYPPDSGPKVKTWNVLKYLTERHELTLVSFVRDDQSADVEHLRQYCSAIRTVPMERGIATDGLAMLRSVAAGQPWMMVRDERVPMRNLVDRLAAQHSFDVVHADQLNMAQYAERVSGAFRVLDLHNALWLLYRRLASIMAQNPRRWLLERDWRLLKQYEGKMVRDFDAVLTVTEEDKAALVEAAGVEGDISVIPIAVDTDEVQPIARHPGGNHILHVGTMYWPPNIDGVWWFIREILPLVHCERPDVIFDVVGSRPPKALKVLGQDGTAINVTGYVPHLKPYLEQAGVFVVPLRAGGGMRVKILNALAQGLPIVSTSLGCEGIDVTDEHDVLIGDTPKAFADAVLRVLDDQALSVRLAENGRRLAESRYDYRRACQLLDVVYAGAAGRDAR